MTGCRRWVLLLAMMAVAACSSMGENTKRTEAWVESRLLALYGDLGGELRYFDGTADLNGDGQPEMIVYVVSPMLCGTGGCNTLVFAPRGSDDELVADVSVSRPPIQVSARTTNGWRNLIVHVSGGGIFPGYDAELRFDGTRYPSNPTVPPAERAPDTAGARIVIPPFKDLTEGKRISPH